MREKANKRIDMITRTIDAHLERPLLVGYLKETSLDIVAHFKVPKLDYEESWYAVHWDVLGTESYIIHDIRISAADFQQEGSEKT